MNEDPKTPVPEGSADPAVGPSRRDFLKATTLGAVAGALAGGAIAEPLPAPAAYLDPRGFAAPKLERVRIGFVGVGLQGGSHVRNFLAIDGVDIRAICDIDAPRAEEVAGWVVAAGRPAPELYTRGDYDWRRLCARDDLDLVFTATPWRWHVPVCVEAMRAGKHAATEVPAATTIDGCWELVETAEQTLRHCLMMENCCYGRREMMILRMVREGVLGEVLHGEAAYIHDLRAIKFSAKNEGLWRLEHSKARNGNLYPTHGLGPVAQCMDIQRGDAFDYLVSMSTPQRGLSLYAAKQFGKDDPRARQHYALGDLNTSLIQTKLGRTILLQHDTTTPRPYSRLNLVMGTEGTVAGYPDRAYLEARSKEEDWVDLETYRSEFDHPLWTRSERDAEGAGHGGMDYLEDLRLVECLRRGEPLEMDIYDAAAWSVVSELTEISVANRGKSVDFPDFTRGRWASRSPLPIGGFGGGGLEGSKR